MLIITKFKASRRHHFISTRHSIFISREVLKKQEQQNNNTNKKQRSTETTNESQPATGGSRYPPPGAPSGDKALYNKINFRLRAAAMPEVVQGQTFCLLSFLLFLHVFVISIYVL